jgi:hypothetical protein
LKRPTADSVWRKFAELFIDNVDAVTQELLETLEKISQTGHRVSDQNARDIFDVTYNLGILSLKMASQRAHLFLEFAGHGERIKIGARFKDTGSKDRVHGEVVVADIMTQPCLVKIGDGAGDFEKEVPLSQGEIIGE